MSPATASSDEVPAVLSVEAVVGTGTAVVTWLPPALAPSDLMVATYTVYGVHANGSLEALEDAPPLTVSAEVQSGFENYAVTVKLNGVESRPVHACVKVVLLPPSVNLDACRA
jgi:hypothetical protein